MSLVASAKKSRSQLLTVTFEQLEYRTGGQAGKQEMAKGIAGLTFGRRRPAAWLVGLVGALVGYLVMRAAALHFQQAQLQKLFVTTAQVMEQCGVDHWFDFGTLLGLHRDGNPVCPSDTDVDVQMASWEDRQRLIDCGAPKFRELGLELDLQRNSIGGIKLSDAYGYYVDMDTWGADPHDPETQLRCRTLPYCQPGFIDTGDHAQFCRIRKDIILPTKAVVWRGQVARVPHRVEELLVLRYGEGWRVPRKFDKGTDTTPWDTFKARIYPVIEFGFVVRTWVVVLWVAATSHWLLLLVLLGVAGFLVHQHRRGKADGRSRMFRNLATGMLRLSQQTGAAKPMSIV